MEKPSTVPGFIPGKALLQTPPTEVLFAITSANQENSRFNPIPFHIRAIGVDRFARHMQGELPFRYRILGIPHYGHTKNFAAFTLKEIADQTEKSVQLTPENCLVLCSTPEVVQLYQELGFSVVTAELSEGALQPATPIEIIREIGARGGPIGFRVHWSQPSLLPAISACSRTSPRCPDASAGSIRTP